MATGALLSLFTALVLAQVSQVAFNWTPLIALLFLVAALGAALSVGLLRRK